jgi:hypothetical protein
MENDGRRGRFGVNVTLDLSEEGRLRLILDDVEARDEAGSQWRKRCLYTFLDVDKQSALEYRLDRELYAGIGDTLLARLLALYDLGEDVEEL